MATENTGANENKKAGEAARKPRPADGKTPVKKKKIIIVTGNGSKGRQSSGQRSAYSSGSYSSGGTGSFTSGSGRKPRPAGQTGARRDQAAGRQKPEAKPVPHKIIRPSVKPTQMEVDFHKPEQVTRQPRKTQEAAPAAEEIKVTTAPVMPDAEPAIPAAAPEEVKKPVETTAAVAALTRPKTVLTTSSNGAAQPLRAATPVQSTPLRDGRQQSPARVSAATQRSSTTASAYTSPYPSAYPASISLPTARLSFRQVSPRKRTAAATTPAFPSTSRATMTSGCSSPTTPPSSLSLCLI